VVESLKECTFLEESLLVVTSRAVGVLGSELMSSSSLSPEKYKAKASGEIFLNRDVQV